MKLTSLRIALLAWLPLALETASLASEKPVDFATQVRPLFAAHCVKCHGPADSQSGLRLDRFDLVRKGGDRGPSVIPGKAARSLLVQALRGQGDLTPMPAEAPRLGKEKIALIERWVNEGVVGPADAQFPTEAKKHWAFQPIRRSIV